MSRSVGDAHSPLSPPDRLAQTTAVVSNSPLLDSHSQILGSRKTLSPAILQGGLIPRDYLSSLSSSRSPTSQSRSGAVHIDTNENVAQTQEAGAKTDVYFTEGTHPPSRHENSDGRRTRTPEDAQNFRETTVSARALNQKEQLSESPTSYASSNTGTHPPNDMPRTSSIDSAISTVSNSTHVGKLPNDGRDVTRDELLNLIATAGGAENLIRHLLRDKNHAAAQNAQLWKLVDKQRSLLLGLNKDLERASKERDRYRKKLKELQAQPSIAQVDRLRDGEAGSPQSENETPIPPKVSEPVAASDLRLRQEQQTPSKSTANNVQVQSSPLDPAMMPSPLHFQQAQKMQPLNTHLAQPVFNVTEATPIGGEKAPKSFQASRKAPPKPLDLRSSKDDLSFVAPAEAIVSGDEEERTPEQRGRRKTREEDDRDREILAIKEQEARSRSKKDKKPAPEETESTTLQQMPLPPGSVEQNQHMRQDHLSPASVASGSVASSNQLSLPLRSPGLPLSPRPMMGALGSALPMSPRAPGGNFPLSPRAPKAALPMPTTPGMQAPAPQSQTSNATTESSKKTTSVPTVKTNISAANEADKSRIHESPMSPGIVPSINRRLVDPRWPDFLLPPNALPSVQVKVASSRLRPSRNSVLGLRPQDENAVFSLSITERATSSELWRVEKLPVSLATLEQNLRPRCADLPRLPDRKVFSGHSPATMDARRQAIDAYLEDLLDTPMDETAAAQVCRYLSTDVIEPPQMNFPLQGTEDSKPARFQDTAPGIPTKSGYLTKKGKNFGGWKSRYFVLDSPDLRYFEAPGGAHLGTIKLLNARIGRQTQNDPSSHPEVDSDNQYRHAFLILEPKRKDSNNHLRHVLCAESDAERDEWVETLMHYIEEKSAEGKSQYGVGFQSTNSKDTIGGPRYEETESKSYPSPQTQVDTPSPSNASSHTPELGSDQSHAGKSLNISGPSNGAVISDAGSWGNKSAGSGHSKEREPKKRNIFTSHFKPSHEQLAPAQPAQSRRSELNAHRNGHVRPVFGMQLQEAVEHYSPVDADVYLPAVVYRCIEFLRAKRAANEEGLFRLSGSNIVIRSLKDRFNTEGDVDLLAENEEYDVHAVASLFKTYLRELPSTILTRELHLEFLKGLELTDKPSKLAMFNMLVHQLPAANFSLLRTLSQYLLEVVQNAERNKMTIKNVGIVFSPTLNIPAPLFAMFLTDFDAIFDARPADQESAPSIEIDREEGALTPEDIRSPRKQMFTDLPTPMYNQESFAQNVQTSIAPPHNSLHNVNVRRSEFQPVPTSFDTGLAPMHPSYESRQYVSNLNSHEHPPPMAAPKYPPPQPPIQQGEYHYGGSHNMMAPQDAATMKARRRESSMLFM
jgi:RalA-binding protein 1